MTRTNEESADDVTRVASRANLPTRRTPLHQIAGPAVTAADIDHHDRDIRLRQ